MDIDNVIDFPIAQDVPSLLWIVNLGCIDLNPCYARCDDVDRPDFLHFDLDPVPPAEFAEVREVALLVKASLGERKVQSYAKTSGSRGMHIYVPIRRAPFQKEVWRVAKRIAFELAKQGPENARVRTVASVYSVRPRPEASVSAPVTWQEVERGISTSDLRTDCMPKRIAKYGALFKAVVQNRARSPLEALI